MALAKISGMQQEAPLVKVDQTNNTANFMLESPVEKESVLLEKFLNAREPKLLEVAPAQDTLVEEIVEAERLEAEE